MVRAFTLLCLLLCFALCSPQATATIYTSSFLGGLPPPALAGFSDLGAGLFYTPRTVLALPSGATLVADRSNNVLRSISSTGVVSTVAGSPTGAQGSANGVGSSSSFNWPTGLTFYPNSSNIVLVSEYNQGLIRKLFLNNFSVVPFVGAAVMGYVDGSCAAARFNNIFAIAASPSTGNVYAAETSNKVVRVVATSPVCNVSTLAGNNNTAGTADGVGTSASFTFLRGIALDDSAGIVYVSDSLSYRIRAINVATAVVTTLVGSVSGYRDGVAASALLAGVLGLVTVDTGTPFAGLIVTDGNTVRRIRLLDGYVTTLAGAAGTGSADGAGSAAQFNGACGMAIDAAGAIIIADSNNNAIRKLTPSPCPAGQYCFPSTAATPIQILTQLTCPAGYYCPGGVFAPVPCSPNTTTLYAGAASSAACAPLLPLSSAINCTASSAPGVLLSPSQLITFPGLAANPAAPPLIFLPVASPLNTAGMDLILASAAACATFNATAGSATLCDFTRQVPVAGSTYYYLGTAASLGMSAAGPTCGA